ncbi:MAG TPA: hypothetical protein DHW42_03510 [Candidatus Marinimicrobia bacterium]|nr:hypothetical protein [Candidatus Neomarinimicrobiota bacterium]
MKRAMKYRAITFLISSLFFFNSYSQADQKYIRLKTGIHFDSKVSGGSYTMAELAGIASSYGLDAIIVTDHDNMKVTYGISPFQNFLKFSIEENSISKYGIENYLQEIEQISKVYPDIIFIPGVEAVPFYYWEGSPFNMNLSLRNWHTHMLVFGLTGAEAYNNLPSIANGGLGHKKPSGDFMKYISENFIHFSMICLYLILFLLAAFSIVRKSYRRRDITHIQKKEYIYKFSWKALFITLIFGYILYSEFPFLPVKYDQYHGNQGAGPFQELIDYVSAKNGLTFWAHPEVAHTEMQPVKFPFLDQTIKIETEAYPQMVTETKNYTGFCIFWEGMQTIGCPGGLWDIALDEYCSGFRAKPVWAIGELDFEGSNDLSQVTATNTFIFAKEKSQAGVLEAIRAGRMYATRDFTGNRIVLDDFSAYDMRTERSAFIGETLLLSSPPVAIHLKIRSIENNSRPTTVYLYKNRDLVKTFRLQNVIDEWFVDEDRLEGSMCYYRILVGSRDYQTLATNPIFVRKY